MNLFLKKNRNKKIVILDVPLLLENKLNKKGDILIFVQSKNSEIYKRLVKRKILIRNYLICLKRFNYPQIIRKRNLILLLKMILPKEQFEII